MPLPLEPSRILLVDADAGALLLDDGLRSSSATSWAFECAGPSLGRRIGELICPPALMLKSSDAPGGGLGVFARRKIRAGEEVLRERPLMTVDWGALPGV